MAPARAVPASVAVILIATVPFPRSSTEAVSGPGVAAFSAVPAQQQSGSPPLPGFVVDTRPASETSDQMRLMIEATATDWLTAVNEYRAAALLPPLGEDLSFQAGCVNHSTYCVKNNVLVHAEDPSLPFYTPEGDLAGRSSNVMASGSAATTDRTAVDLWMAGPFHAVGIIDPVLERTGFGSYREVKSGIQMAATLDVLRGRNPSKSVTFPVIWPADGQAMPARCSGGSAACYFGGETPDPLASCPGYSVPSGLPLILQLGKGSVTPNVGGHSLLRDGTPLEHCVFDETSYTNPDGALQSLGRAVLGARDAIVLVPRLPLETGRTYTASISVNGATYTWNFGVGAPVTPTPGPIASARADGDYDGDGRKDVAVYRPSSGTWYIIRSGANSAVAIQWGQGGDVPVPADFDGDGKTDLAVYRPTMGTWYILQSATGAGVGIQWGAAADVPLPADYDGDGRADIAVYRPSSSLWYIVRSGTNSAIGVAWGQGGDVPVPADFDGDGKADPTVFRPGTGTWYQLRSTTGSGFAVVWGQSGDAPLADDFDGDRKADPTVFRASSGTWYQLRSLTGIGFGALWGATGDLPIPGDYDGDGKADPTVFRPSSGTWYQLRTTTGTALGVVWGVLGDVPM